MTDNSLTADEIAMLQDLADGKNPRRNDIGTVKQKLKAENTLHAVAIALRRYIID